MANDDMNNNNDTTHPTMEEQQLISTATTDLASLSRVSHRLALVDETAQLEKVLEKLLPRLLKRIGENHQQQQQQQMQQQCNSNTQTTGSTSQSSQSQTTLLLSTLLQQIQAKLMEMFSHILKRIRHDRSCQLPCAAILELFVTVSFINNNHAGDNNNDNNNNNSAGSIMITRNNTMDSLTRNLSLTFLTLGVPRFCHHEIPTTTGAAGISDGAKQQQQQQHLAQDLLPSLLVLAADSSRLPAAAASSTSNSSAASLPQQQQAAQWAHLLLHCLQGLATTTKTTTTSFPSSSNKRTFSNAHVENSNNNSNKDSTSASTAAAASTTTDPFIKARAVLLAQQRKNDNDDDDDDSIGRAIYDLFLDVLLYTPQPVIMMNTAAATAAAPPPPPGLSQAGRDRLCPPVIAATTQQGDAAASASWNNHPARMTLAKLAIVEAIAPSRRMALFLKSTSSSDNRTREQKNKLDEKNNDNDDKSNLGLARTVALLVVASGSSGGVLDHHHHHTATTSSRSSVTGNVAENATLYLKMHLDSHRGRAGGTAAAVTSSSATAAFGNDPTTLALELLTLCLGQHHAESLLKNETDNGNNNINNSAVVGLGQCFSVHNTTSNNAGGGVGWSQQEILSTKRRAVSESMAAILLSFCASKILEENLTIFSRLQDHHREEGQQQQQQYQVLQGICTLALNVSSKMLTNSGVITTNMSKNQAKPQLAASSLLQALVAPLSIYYDNMNIIVNSTMGTTTAPTMTTTDAQGRGNNNKDSTAISNNNTMDFNSTDTDRTIGLLLAKAVGIACHVLSSMITAAASSTTSSMAATSAAGGSEGSLAVRDHCYGVICTLSRCRRFALEPEGFLFSQGQNQQAAAGTMTTTANNASAASSSSSKTTSQSIVVSTETAVLLFGCAAHEEERLRPRATAALDALLAAYFRVANIDKSSDNDNTNDPQETTPVPSTAATADGEPPDNPWANVNDAVSDIKSTLPSNHVVTVDREMLARSLLPLLWMATQSHRPKASRIAAARWAGGLLKHLDLVRSCHILCFLAGDSDTTVQGLANEGLGLINKHIVTEDVPLTDSAELPHFGEFVDLVFQTKENNSKLQRFWEFAFLGKAAALRYALLCLMNDIYGGDDKAVGIYLSALTETLSFFARESKNVTGRSSLDLLDQASACFLVTLSTSQFARRQIASSAFGFSLRDMESLALSANSSMARRHLAGACAKLYEDASLWRTGDSPVTSLVEWLNASGVDQVLDRCSGRINDINKSHVAVGQQHGIAYLAANVVRAFRLQSLSFPEQQIPDNSCFDKCATILSALAQGTLHSDEIIANASSDGLKIGLSYDALDSPCLDERLSESSSKVLSCLARALRKYGDGDGVDVPRVMNVIRASSVCLGATTTAKVANLVELGAARMDCVKALLQLLGAMSFRKDEEIGLIVGEALAQYADCAAVGHQDSIEWSEDFDDDFAGVLPPNEHVLYVLIMYNLTSSSPHKRTAAAPAMLGLIGRVARGVNTDPSYENRPLVRTLLKHLDKVQALFIQLLVDPKTKHLSRESCCLGLAACRGLAKASDNSRSSETGDAVSDMNLRILRAFGSTTNFGGSAMQETNIQAAQRRAAEAGSRSSSGPGIMEQFGVESEVGGAAGIGEASLGAYREMAAASVSLGQPEMLYALLILSVSHTAWFEEGTRDRYSAASLLGEDNFTGNRTNSNQMREALRPHLGKLLPRILRARHDPNPQTREQMTSLWVGLTGGGAASRLAITQNLLTTLDVLIEDASSKLWRARVGALGGMAEIIVGREWSALGGGPPSLSDDDLYDGHLSSAGAGVRLLRLWRVVTRALDDIRGAVRESGESLGRSVRALTIRLCDPTQTDKSSGEKRGREEQLHRERDASAAAATSVRWIVKHGLNQPVPEAAGLCISTLTEIVGICRPKVIESVLPDLLRSLLTAVSGLEPAALNYLQLRVDNQEGLERLRLEIVQRGPLATAVTKCLELLAQSSIHTQQAVIPQLNTALRLSAGFATRAAVADAVATMCSTCQAAFSFPGVIGTANPSVQLMRAFYFAAERERGQGAKDRMVHALGTLAALCPGKSVRSLVVRACNKYNLSTGNQDDPASRRAAAAVIRAIAVRASNQLSEGGVSDIWTRIVLPVAFLGQKDEDKKISSYFREVWDEGGQLQLSHKCGTRLEEKLLPELTNECVRALQDVSWSRRVAGANALMELCSLGVLSPAPRSTGSSSSIMESSNLLRSRQRAKSSNLALQECIKLLTKPRLWTGKSTIVETTVKIVASWVAAEADVDRDARILYGWEEAKGNCPYQPVCLSDASLDDFFVGDKWFTTTPMEETEDPMTDDPQKALPQDTEKETSEEDSGGKLDFEETDSSFPDEDAGNRGNDAMVVPVEEVFEVVTFAGLCRFLVMEALPETKKESLCMSDEHLPYRTKALHAFRDLMTSLPTKSNSDHQRVLVFQRVANRFIATFEQQPNSEETKKEPPVIVAAAIESLGSCLWEGFGGSMTGVSGLTVDVDPSALCTMLQTIGGSEAWTVREAALLVFAQLARACDEKVLRRIGVISCMMESVSLALKDRKFWRVRHAGLKLVDNLVQRTGTSSDRKQLILETLLPYKEEIQSLLRKSLADSEPKVTAVSSEVLTKLAWWP